VSPADRPAPPRPRSGPVRFALVGCGNIGRTHAEALTRLAAAGTAELVAVHDVLPERAAAFGADLGVPALGWDALLHDPAVEALTICTPSGTHAALGVAALEAGMHVVVEKPMDADLAQARLLQAAAERTGLTLGVISQHRFDPGTRTAADVLARGGIGRPTLVEVSVPWWRPQSYYDADAWRGTWAGDGGGALINQAIHTVDLMLALAGPVTRVQAVAATRAHRIEVEDVVCAVLTFADGAIGTLSASTAVGAGMPARLALYGDGGVLVLEGDAVTVDLRADGTRGTETAPSADALSVAGAGSRAVAPSPAGQAPVVAAWGRAHEEQLADVAAAVRTGRPPLVGAEEGVRALALVDAVYRAACTGVAVDLGEPAGVAAPRG
jgi:UDP-N-acetyl-2-amino-2-deoxyglucuronate dehydrogenase